MGVILRAGGGEDPHSDNRTDYVHIVEKRGDVNKRQMPVREPRVTSGDYVSNGTAEGMPIEVIYTRTTRS